MTKWLVDQGARYIILASRNAADNPRVHELVLELETIGVKVSAHNCDVTVREQVDEVIRLSQQIMPPIRGAIHSVMVVRV